MSEVLFYGGIALSGTAILCGIIAAIILRLLKLRLNKQLDAEYGKRGH